MTGKTGITDSSVTIEARGETFEFSGIAPKERTMEMADEIEGAGGRPARRGLAERCSSPGCDARSEARTQGAFVAGGYGRD